MDPPDEAFYSEVNDRHGLSTAWVPCIHSAWFGSVAHSLFALCPIQMHYTSILHCIIQYA